MTDYKIALLNELFYKRVARLNFLEMMSKPKRPFFFLVKVKGHNFAIPFRSSIKHNFCFKTIPSPKVEGAWSGLDYSKAVIFYENDVDSTIARINIIEKSMVDKNYRKIKTAFKNYVEDYIKINKDKTKDYSEMKIAYEKSTLQNYHKELGLEK